MDSEGHIFPMNASSAAAITDFEKRFEEKILPIPQAELEEVVGMNREQRRNWYRSQKKRKGFTR